MRTVVTELLTVIESAVPLSSSHGQSRDNCMRRPVPFFRPLWLLIDLKFIEI